MLKFKRCGKVMAAALCFVLCIACVIPASALSTSSVTGVTTQVAGTTVLNMENMAAESQSHLVSQVHYGASSSTVVIGCLENGSKLTVLGTKKGFYKIDCGDMNGYIAVDQVIQDENGDYYISADPEHEDSKYLNSYSTQTALQLRSSVVQLSQKYLGVRYVLGGMSKRGFDCSGLLKYVFNEAGIELGRTVRNQMQDGIIIAKEDLQAGDLVVFSNTVGYGFASHIGIYLGNGQMIHAGEKGVKIVSLDGDYYTRHYQCSIRIILSDVAAAATLPTVSTITSTVGSGWRNGD